MKIPKTFVSYRKVPLKFHLAVGPCPHCGRLDNWLNNVPLTAYCGGSESNPHQEWEKVVPSPHNPYSDNYNPDAEVDEIEYEYLGDTD